MISRVQYLKALETIDLYHRQKSKIKDFSEGVERIVEKPKTDLSDVEIGDWIVYSRICTVKFKNFILGKKYRIIDRKSADNVQNSDVIKIQNEFGKATWIKVRNYYRSWERL
jgi:hypothetical protein